MDTKKQTDRPTERRPEDMAGQGRSADDSTKPDVRRQAKAPDDRRELGKPEGSPFDRPALRPDMPGRSPDTLEGERSDRESGRPVRLEDDKAGKDRRQENEPTTR